MNRHLRTFSSVVRTARIKPPPPSISDADFLDLGRFTEAGTAVCYYSSFTKQLLVE